MKYDAIEMIIQNSENGTIYDVSSLAYSVSTSKPIDSSTGKCSFSLDTNKVKISFPMGSTVSFRVKQEGKWYGKFFGYIFSAKPNADELVITAYDQLRYLKNKESYVLTNNTMEGVIKLIANDFGLRIGVIEGVGYKLPERIEDNKALGDIIQRAIDFTLQGIGIQYIIRDEFGYLCCRNIAKLTTNVVIGDNSLLQNYTYQEDIDTQTYNSIKLYKDNKDTGKREVYIVKDSKNIKKWGLLQEFQSVDENATTAQITQKAEQMLKLYNKPKTTLKLECKGVIQLEPGNGIYLQLTDIPGITFNQMALISSIEDKYDNGIHIMSLEVQYD